MAKSSIAISYKSLNPAQCNKCIHRNAYRLNLKSVHCDAFLNSEIPDEIISNKFDHTKPYPGDNGILFEAVNS